MTDFEDLPLVTMHLPLPVKAVAANTAVMTEVRPNCYLDNENGDEKTVVIREKKSSE